MDDYQCKFGLFHDKPCIDREPRSNNGWIYTAISKYALGLEYEPEDFKPLYYQCCRQVGLYTIYRLPDKELPPISRDEIIGMTSLGLPIHTKLILNSWCMYNHSMLRHIPMLDSIKTLWKIRDKHRNYFWDREDPILEVYPIAMRIFWHDRYYIKKMKNYPIKPLEFFSFYLYAISIIFRGSAGEQNLLYLQLKDIGSYLARFIPYRKNFLEYFGPGHIFNRHNLKK